MTKMWTFEYKTQTCFILQGKLSEKSSVEEKTKKIQLILKRKKYCR